MPRRAVSKPRSSAEANTRPQQPPPKSNRHSSREPSLRDLRRRLVGIRYDLLKRLLVTVFAIGTGAWIASHVHPESIASQYPSATADAHAAMSALAANVGGTVGSAYSEASSTVRDTAGSAYGKMAAMMHKAETPAAESASRVAAAATTHHRIARKVAPAHRLAAVSAKSHAALHSHAHRRRVEAAHAASAKPAVVAAGEAAGDWFTNEFPGQFSYELDKAYYKFLSFASSAIELDWAPGLRDQIRNTMQTAMDTVIGNGGGFQMSDLTWVLAFMSKKDTLVAGGTGILMFTLMLGLSGWLRPARGFERAN